MVIGYWTLRRVPLLVAAALIVVSALWWMPAIMRRMQFFDVRQVEVTGAKYREARQIIAGLELPETSSVWDDLTALEARLEKLGGIEEAHVGRRLPGTLKIRVKEVEPVALAQTAVGLVAVDRAARALPYDPTLAVIDVPVMGRPDPRLAAALDAIRTASGTLYAMAAAAWRRGDEIVLDVGPGLMRLDAPVSQPVVASLLAVRRDLDARAAGWREIDGRFRGWIVVR
jgi:hypothetical protein